MGTDLNGLETHFWFVFLHQFSSAQLRILSIKRFIYLVHICFSWFFWYCSISFIMYYMMLLWSLAPRNIHWLCILNIWEIDKPNTTQKMKIPTSVRLSITSLRKGNTAQKSSSIITENLVKCSHQQSADPVVFQWRPGRGQGIMRYSSY